MDRQRKNDWEDNMNSSGGKASAHYWVTRIEF